MRALIRLVAVEATLVARSGLAALALALVLAGGLAIVQEPAFARRQGLDLAWASIEAWLVLGCAGGLPWLWLQAHAGASARAWELRAVLPPVGLVLAAWLALVVTGVALATAGGTAMFTLDRILGHGVPPGRVVAAVGTTAWSVASLGGVAVALRWLDPPLPLRAALWIAVLGAGALLPAVPDALAAALAGAAGLAAAHALLLRRLAGRH